VATLSLLDPDQGVCPSGHLCRLSDTVGERLCDNGEYQSRALVCWSVDLSDIDRAERAGADPLVVGWSRSFLADRIIGR
jgi:hypothetical protein